ncbi:MAG: LytTR family transcriptional regulator, partial [Bacteroidia bacterium]
MATQAINIEINKPREKFMWVSLTVVLGFVFMVFFEPFNLFANSSATVFDVVFELAIASLIAFIILLLTQFVARELFGLKSFTRLGLIAWYLLESLLVGIVWSLADEVDHSTSHNFWEQIPINFLAFVSIFAIPYFGYVFWFNSKKLKQQLVEAAETRKVE